MYAPMRLTCALCLCGLTWPLASLEFDQKEAMIAELRAEGGGLGIYSPASILLQS